MQLPRIIALFVAFFSLGNCLTTSEQNNLTIRSNEVGQPQCDSICVRRIFFEAAYASASLGVLEAMNAYQSFDWCVNEQQNWCPETMNSTLSAIAGRAATNAALSIDVQSCDDQCLVTSLPTITSKSAFSAMVWAEKTFNGTSGGKDMSQRNADVERLRRMMWQLRKESLEPVQLDADTISSIFSCDCNPSTEPTPAHPSIFDDDFELSIDSTGIFEGHGTFTDDSAHVDSSGRVDGTANLHVSHPTSVNSAAKSPGRGCICGPGKSPARIVAAPVPNPHSGPGPSPIPAPSQAPKPQTDAPSHHHYNNESPSPKPHTQAPSHHDHHKHHDDDDDDDDDDDHHKALAIALPFLATGAGLLAPYALKAAACIDPILCEASKLKYLSEVFKATDGVLSKISPFSWFRNLFQRSKKPTYDHKKSVLPDSEETTQRPPVHSPPPEDDDYPRPGDTSTQQRPRPQEPPPENWEPEDDDLYGDDDFPLEPEGEELESPSPFKPNPPFEDPADQDVEPVVPEQAFPDPEEVGEIKPVNPKSIFRAERYDPKTGRLEQQTLLRAPPKYLSNPLKGKQLISNGYKPFFPLDSKGRIMRESRKLREDGTNPDPDGYRIVWQKPGDLKPMEGDWRRITGKKSKYDQYVRYESGKPALSSLGDPLVRSPQNVMETAEPSDSQGQTRGTRFNDEVRFRLFDTEGNAVQGSRDGSASLLELRPSDPNSIEWSTDDELVAESPYDEGAEMPDDWEEPENDEEDDDGAEIDPSMQVSPIYEPEDPFSTPQVDGAADQPPQATGAVTKPVEPPRATPTIAGPGDSTATTGEVVFNPDDHPAADEHAPGVAPPPQATALWAAPVRFITVTATVTAEPTQTPAYEWQTEGDYAGLPYKCSPFYDGKPPKWCPKYYEQILKRDSPVWDHPCSLPLWWFLPPVLRPQPDRERAIICPPPLPPNTTRTLHKNGKMDIVH